jgi:hypothetical protein
MATALLARNKSKVLMVSDGADNQNKLFYIDW